MTELKKIFCLLALLLLGSAGIRAQDDGSYYDPFPDVPINDYELYMTVTGFVRLGGVKVTKENTVVTAYHGDEIRGKKRLIDSGNYTDLLMLAVYGKKNGEHIHFKVYVNGYIIEVDQGLEYNSSKKYGKASDPYYIDLPLPVVTTFSEEGWATTCLPFNSKIPDDVTVYTAKGVDKMELVLQKWTDPVLPANMPVLLYSNLQTYTWCATVSQPTATVDKNILEGVLEETKVPSESVLTLGHSLEEPNDLGFWIYIGNMLPANCAYIPHSSGIKGLTLRFEDDETSSITDTSNDNKSSLDFDRPIYDLQGRRVSLPLLSGCSSIMVIQDGKKYIIR